MVAKSLYVAGPMTGLPEFNFPAFNATAAKLRADGWVVFNPAEKDEEAALNPEACKTGDDQLAIATGFDFKAAYMWDIDKVINSDGIYMLPGWEASPGARGEHAVACVMKYKYPNYQIIYAGA